jgi:NAD(P)-dependent dehydrogenase (short-subunit alcohol dehydrogenase family)
MAEPALLAGKRCLLVGGAGGLGRAAARRFLGQGARLVLAGEDDRAGGEAVAELASLGEVSFVVCDATAARQVEGAVGQVVARLGGLDVLYHLAGASGRRAGDASLHECSLPGWQWTLKANLTSVFLTNRAAVEYFLGAGQPGCILNLASVLALAPAPHHFDTCAYAAAKGGIIALSRQAAAAYAPHGIRVNVLAPGLIDTPMSTRAVGDPAIQHYLKTKQPLAGGAGRPDDCAGAAAWLCSDAARLVTGVVLPVDGGWCVSEGQYSN